MRCGTTSWSRSFVKNRETGSSRVRPASSYLQETMIEYAQSIEGGTQMKSLCIGLSVVVKAEVGGVKLP